MRANDQGTPLEVVIEQSEMRRGADALARDIVALCREAARTAGLARRAELARAGVGGRVLGYMGLPEPAAPQDLSCPSGSSVADDADPVQSWLR
ncbi:hypothetical protein [Tsukamurella soli]|uniref:hypothetical protein n=1 Tax=Tsukamurella soli TaxID=644556 RepID=UPI0036197078